jgi:ABC-type dipeptide/oligopeptide/nickel transport system ATPase component
VAGYAKDGFAYRAVTAGDRLSNMGDPVLTVDLSVSYPGKPAVLRGAKIEVLPGEILGLVGQSGSGKSTLALAILRLLGHTGAETRGKITLLGRDLITYTERQMRDVRGRLISLIPQSPDAALNPALRIGAQMREAWHAHSREYWGSQTERVLKLMASCGLPADASFLQRFPSQISVGQAQRVLIVMALLHAPALLIADEPTSALDLITQREVLDLLARINTEQQMSVLFISHDLVSVAALCHRLAILHEGFIVERGPVRHVIHSPVHPYTRQLIAAIPRWE